MDRHTSRRGIFSGLISALCLAPLLPLRTTAAASPGHRPRRIGRYHKLTLPEFDRHARSDCQVQRDAYAAALTALEDAQEVADDTYAAWLDCEYPPEPPAAQSIAGTVSILEK